MQTCMVKFWCVRQGIMNYVLRFKNTDVSVRHYYRVHCSWTIAVSRLVSVTPIVDRCIKSSTQPCNLHRQTLAVEWAALRSSVTFNMAPSEDVTFLTSQFIKFLPCESCPGQLKVLLLWSWNVLEQQQLSREVVGHTSSQTGPPSAEVRSTEISSVVGCITHFQVPNWLWKQCQHKHCSLRASWNGFPWLSSRTQA